ncbi:MAG: putative Fe-S cluster assembly protein SufT [Chthoniobacteraceae bacterium]
MNDSATILKREVTATRIPQGEALMLPKGTSVIITQALGGSFTVLVPSEAGLYRIDAEFADALGRENQAPAPVESGAESGPVNEEQVWETLKTCYDPEIPVNIVDLGLIYHLDIKQAPEGANIAVQMTLTAPGCGMGPIIAGEAQQKILLLSGVANADVQVVWDPPWSPDKITEEGKKKLGMV